MPPWGPRQIRARLISPGLLPRFCRWIPVRTLTCAAIFASSAAAAAVTMTGTEAV
jgi:hypothetical protein